MNADSRPAGSGDSHRPAEQLTGTWQQAGETADGSSSVEVTVTYDTSAAGHKAGSEKLYLMRDASNPDGPVLAFTPAEWEAFILGVKDGEFDIAP